MKKLLALLALFFATVFSSQASHIVGGDMYYDYLGNNQYKVYIAIYRDCASSGAAYDDPLFLGVFNSSNQRVTQIEVPFPGSTVLPIIFTNPCVTAPSGICTERAIYTTIVTLPPTPGGYTLAYQRCCRGPNVTNLNNPDDTGLTLSVHITGTNSNALVNSSPRFINYPPLVICNNENLIFDHSATDPDGDSLSYQLVTPNAGANSITPLPNPIPTPPYPFVQFGGTFSATAPLGQGSTTTINPSTGQLFVDANLLGLYVVGIRVNEWRNGVIISSTTRDFLFRVVNCIVQLSAEVTDQENTAGFVSYCQGLSFTFDNQSFGASSYAWDFGVSGITTDVSTLFEPTYTFPAPGIYTITLIANPGWPCTDTTTMTLNLNNPLDVNFNFVDSVCFKDNSIDFTGQVVVGDPTAALSWNFGPNGTPQTGTGSVVNNVHFTNPTGNIVTLKGTYGICVDSISKPVFLYAAPASSVAFQNNHECLGLTQSFINQSSNAVSYAWDFGVNGINTDVSSVSSPTYTFPSPGTYTVTLISEIIPGCSDTMYKDITVYEPLSVDFTHTDSLCITNNSYDFFGVVSGPSITNYTWNFGPNATPSSSTGTNALGIHYLTPGFHTVTLTGQFLTCSESAQQQVYVFKNPTIGFELLDDLLCAPDSAHFLNTSTSDSPLIYSWDFGDGGSSSIRNPTHYYPNVGQYSVTLTIQSTYGCVETLTLEKPGLIVVHPKPVSGFVLDKLHVDICNAEVTFTDLSSGALYYYYRFDDKNGAYSNDQAPIYTYTSDGNHYPVQIVTNEFGCSDSSRQHIMIDPFPIYIPNTFTPDGNEFNPVFRAVLGLDPVTWEMTIYNRWGELVFKSNDFTESWDGTFNDLLAPDGIYSYKVKFTSCAAGAEEEILTGHVSLLR